MDTNFEVAFAHQLQITDLHHANLRPIKKMRKCCYKFCMHVTARIVTVPVCWLVH